MEFMEIIRLVRRQEQLLLSLNTFKNNFDFTEYKINEDIIKQNNIDYNYYKKMIRSNDSKYRRLKKRINIMTISKCWFCTFTISDKYINKNHKRKLKEMYKGYNYIFNEDFGKINNRKHYHGIIQCEDVPKAWSYGFCSFKEIKKDNIEQLARYINKLTAHALKDTAERIIYSRKK